MPWQVANASVPGITGNHTAHWLVSLSHKPRYVVSKQIALKPLFFLCDTIVHIMYECVEFHHMQAYIVYIP